MEYAVSNLGAFFIPYFSAIRFKFSLEPRFAELETRWFQLPVAVEIKTSEVLRRLLNVIGNGRAVAKVSSLTCLIIADRPAESVVDILPDSVDFANGFDVGGNIVI